MHIMVLDTISRASSAVPEMPGNRKVQKDTDQYFPSYRQDVMSNTDIRQVSTVNPRHKHTPNKHSFVRVHACTSRTRSYCYKHILLTN